MSLVFISTDIYASTVFPDTLVRLCQFHIIQAIQRWMVDRGNGDKLSDPDNPDGGPAMKLRLSKKAKADLLQEFRLTQRCRAPQSYSFGGLVRQKCNRGVCS